MTNNFTFLFICLLLCIPDLLNSQSMTIGTCPETVECLDGVVEISDIFYYESIDMPGVQSCGETPNGQMNFKFEAKSNYVHIFLQWVVSLDDVMKVGLVSGCIPYGECIAFETCEFQTGQHEIESSELIVGHEYVVFIDGCSGSVQFDLTITPGDDNDLTAIEGASVTYANGCSSSHGESNSFCRNTPLGLDLFIPDENMYDYFIERDAIYNFEIEGSELSSFSVDNILSYNFFIDEPGDYTLCLKSVELTCETYEIDFCTEFTVYISDEDLGLYEVCQSDLETGNWEPFDTWYGEQITEEGSYEITTIIDCECEISQTIEIIQLDEIEETVEIELCLEDYPYLYFNDYEYDYSQFDIEEFLYIINGSFQEDYNGVECDSLIKLILVNEDSESKCSSCIMPFSLEKSKIIYCIPFDNSAIDVSGKRNRVEAVGIAFDDNGSSNNVLWEAVFDGNNDYVSLPHIDDLNTSVFSFNFQFNKDDPFENGDTETLVSKGDVANDNLRFEINLEKVNESIFDLVSTFYTPTGSVQIEMPNLQIFKWYDVAYVVETDSISLYLDGYLYEKKAVNETLRGNSENLYLGTLADNNRIQFYNGRLDDFKYWKQKLSGQDVLFLHIPEKEFEVEQSYFLSCCEQAEFRDVIIDINNALDSVIVPNASPTGYDSVYVLNYIQADVAPEINLSLAPTDIVVQYQQSCQEFCQSTIDWSTDLTSLFTDNCGNVTVSQSHPFDVTLDENTSFVEVEIIGTDICGQSTTYSFGLELECLPSNVIQVPEENAFEILSNNNCINDNDEICIYSDILLQFGFIDQVTNSLEPYDTDSNFDAVISINDIDIPISPNTVNDGFILEDLIEGSYTICLQNVSNACAAIVGDTCKTITTRDSKFIDHGEITACRDDIESALPNDLSASLTNLILSNPQETTVSITEVDDCGCSEIEKISLAIIESSIEELRIELCDGENYEGLNVSGTYTDNFVASNGCDSTRTIELLVLPNVEEFVFAEICEGQFFENFNETGIYTELFTASNGCDSTVVIDLNVLPKSLTDVFVEICHDSLYLGLNETGVYEFLDTNIFGCDSITMLNLIVLEETHPSCFVSSIDNVSNQVKIYPNPVSDFLTIVYDINLTATIYNVNGGLVDIKQNQNRVDVSKLTNGIYFIQLKSGNETLVFTKFIKL